MSQTTRRALLAGTAGAAVASALAGCGGDPSSGGRGYGDGGSAGDGGSTGGGATGGESGTGNGQPDGPLAKVAEIPVGGGKVVEDRRVVITQPTAGSFRAFTAVCTHQGCVVASVANGVISCPCHGSEYSAVDGSVRSGPALRALAAKKIEVVGDSITLA